MARAVQTAEISAAVQGVPVRVRHDLREFGIGGFAGRPFELSLFEPIFTRWQDGDLAAACPGAETGSDVVRRVADTLESIADLHRGETVLVVSHGVAMQLAAANRAPGLTSLVSLAGSMANCATAELEIDADGWRCVSWAGSPI